MFEKKSSMQLKKKESLKLFDNNLYSENNSPTPYVSNLIIVSKKMPIIYKMIQDNNVNITNLNKNNTKTKLSYSSSIIKSPIINNENNNKTCIIYNSNMNNDKNSTKNIINAKNNIKSEYNENNIKNNECNNKIFINNDNKIQKKNKKSVSCCFSFGWCFN
jgi:hypothetical protein